MGTHLSIRQKLGQAVTAALIVGSLVGCGGGGSVAGQAENGAATAVTASSGDTTAVATGSDAAGITVSARGMASKESGTATPSPTPRPAASPVASALSITATGCTCTVNGVAVTAAAAGATVAVTANTPPSGQVFSGWSGSAPLVSTSGLSTTFVMPQGAVTVTAQFGAQATIAQPVASHPRLWITQADLPKLRGWAAASNSTYQQGIAPLVNGAINVYNTQYFPGGVQNATWPDPGDTQGYTGPQTEQYALLFAFQSLIDPNPTNAAQHAQRARNLLMVAMNEAAKGVAAGQPFRDPKFVTFNRGNASASFFPLVVDWIYNATDANGKRILTSQDLTTIRKVFLTWSNQCLNANTTNGDHPSPVGTTTQALLLPNGKALRTAANNYYLGHARLLTMMALCIDPADDPAVDPRISNAVLGNTLRSYIKNATGAWLLQEYAMFGDRADVISRLGLPAAADVGLASGGTAAEGSMYGHSIGFLFGQLLALKTAGYDDPALSGPQAALVNNPIFFDRYIRATAASLVPVAQVPTGGNSYLGPIFSWYTYGDILRTWLTPEFSPNFALLGLLDQKNGVSTRLNAERWFVNSAIEGGAGKALTRVSNPWAYGVDSAILTFLLMDPNAAAATDPRASLGTAHYDAGQGRLYEHTSYSATSSMVAFSNSWSSIDHQQADANRVDFHRNGEWLTRGIANYDTQWVGQATDYQNTVSIHNWCQAGKPTTLSWFEGTFWTMGSQWLEGYSAGDPTTTCDVQGAYTYVNGDATNLYNRPAQWSAASAALDVQNASRSLLWIKPDRLVIFDRAKTLHTGLDKHLSLGMIATPALTQGAGGAMATEVTPQGQRLYVQSLLPAGATMKTSAIAISASAVAALEPAKGRLVVQDTAGAADTCFLTVLEGADATKTAPDSAVLVKSTAGTAFDGAVLNGQNAVMFVHDAKATFSSTTYTVPGSVTTHYLCGLTPAAGYTVTRTVTAGGVQVTITPGGTVTADAGGVLVF
ncbi:MAG: hypothetical protein EB084_11135 [Proteobacteria bacterium]|nr:hypothetical protein [Pseudomonadota bacterium]